MATFTLTIDTGNAAFFDNDAQPEPGPELARILHAIAERIADGPPDVFTTIYDVNGNDVGRYAHKEPDQLRCWKCGTLPRAAHDRENPTPARRRRRA